MKPFIRIAIVLGALYGAAALDVAHADAKVQELTYSLIVTRDGHDYVEDYNLSDEDCFSIVDDYANARCEAE